MISLKDFDESLKLTTKHKAKDLDSLQERLYILLRIAEERKILTLIILEGWSATGKGEMLSTITERLDPRKFRVYSPMDTEHEDKRHHFMTKYWMNFPRNGECLILLRSWYHRLSTYKIKDKIKESEYVDAFQSVLNTERLLSEDKTNLYKFFFHISKKEMKKRLEKAQSEKKNWRIQSQDIEELKDYKTYRDHYETYLYRTNTVHAPWTIINAKDLEAAKIFLLETLVDSLEKKLEFDSSEKLQLLKTVDESVIQ